MPLPRTHVAGDVAAKLLYEADHPCCICRDKKFDVQLHHIRGRSNSKPGNLIVLCLNCHSEVEKKGGHGRSYSPGELQRYKKVWLHEVAIRRKTVRSLDKSLALFEVKRLTYMFQALEPGQKEEPRALEIMRIVMQFARDFRYEVRELCVSFVYETADWLTRGVGSHEFVSHQGTILLECLPGNGSLVASSRKPLTKQDVALFQHMTNVAGEITYSVCKYIRDKRAAEAATMLLGDVLRFAVLNSLKKCKSEALEDFSSCERICRQAHRGKAFDAGIKLLQEWRGDALDVGQNDTTAAK